MDENKEVVLTNEEYKAIDKLKAIKSIAEKFWPGMTLLVAPDKRLNTVSTLVTEEEFTNGSIETLTETMSSSMRVLRGVGLSAIQVNIPKQVFVINHVLAGETSGHRVFANPVLTGVESKKITVEEGCLSFPGLYISVARDEKISVEARDEKGNTFTLNLEGLASVVIQHEYDHLIGRTFLDAVSKLKRDFYKKKYEKLIAKREEY